jgi:DNA-binding IclR family transcriptional regulator
MGIAAPIFDLTGSTVGVLSLGFPATRETDAVFVEEAVHNVKQAAAEISANLGHSGAATSPDETEATDLADA